MESMAWRTSSAEALQEAARLVEAEGITGEWFDGPSIGRAYRFTGHEVVTARGNDRLTVVQNLQFGQFIGYGIR